VARGPSTASSASVPTCNFALRRRANSPLTRWLASQPTTCQGGGTPPSSGPTSTSDPFVEPLAKIVAPPAEKPSSQLSAQVGPTGANGRLGLRPPASASTAAGGPLRLRHYVSASCRSVSLQPILRVAGAVDAQAGCGWPWTPPSEPTATARLTHGEAFSRVNGQGRPGSAVAYPWCRFS